MRRALFIVTFMLPLMGAKASHIVGGEMALVHIENTLYRYKIEMILYYDAKFGATGGDRTALVRIFRKRDNSRVFDIVLNAEGPISSIGGFAIGTPVKYFQPECSNGSIETNRVFYQSVEFELSPDLFSDPEGYYMVYERCCRNYSITNIFSQDPNNPNSTYDKIAGQIFYLEFPPVIKAGEPFINSSPKLFPPLSDYGCPYRRYFVDFAGTDADGDSLVYSLVTPLNSKERQFALPNGGPNPGPYDSITWKGGFSNTNFMNGNPDLRISNDGLLTITPTGISIGLFVFAVRCEEFRDGIKIGEVRRDFQMLIQDACPLAEPPVIVGRPLGGNFGTSNQLTVTFDNTVSDGDRCFEVRVSDPDALKFDDGFSEDVKIKAFPIGFRKDIRGILPKLDSATITNDETAVFKICLPKCSYTGGIYQIGIVAFDDACTLPLSDTLYVTVDIEPPPNQKPQFNNTGGLKIFTETLEEGDDAKSWDIEVTDAENHLINYRLVPVGFTLEDVGMSFTPQLFGKQAGPINKTLTWDPKCDVYDFTKQTDFRLYFIVEDDDVCKLNNSDTTIFNLTINLPGNFDPVIDNSVLSNATTLEITRKIYGEPIVFSVTGTDADADDLIVLRGSGVGFSPVAYGVTFPKQTGKESLESLFQWTLDCNTIDLSVKDVFEFNLMVVDSTNKCRFYNADTLKLIVKVEPPDNFPPELTVVSENPEQPIMDGSLLAILRTPITLSLTGTDADNLPQDVLRLEIIDQQGNVPPEGFAFTVIEGTSPVQTSFTWNPDCSVFKNGVYENNYTFTFRLSDNRCFHVLDDTFELNIVLRDVDGGDDDFLPPNIFTPNNDGLNDFFAMVKEESPGSGELVNILPQDNCLGEFVSFSVYNRWGKQVYQTVDREFRWYGGDLPVGVYYYFIRYTNKEYKGLVTIRF
jgi:hypothetical protein